MIIISTNVLTQLHDLIKGSQSMQREVCALLFGKKSVNYQINEIEAIPNRARSSNRFHIGRDDYESCIKRHKRDLIGIFHTHLNGESSLSVADKQQIKKTKCLWLIGVCEKTIVKAYTFDEEKQDIISIQIPNQRC